MSEMSTTGSAPSCAERALQLPNNSIKKLMNESNANPALSTQLHDDELG